MLHIIKYIHRFIAFLYLTIWGPVTGLQSKVDGPMRLNWTVERYTSGRSWPVMFETGRFKRALSGRSKWMKVNGPEMMYKPELNSVQTIYFIVLYPVWPVRIGSMKLVYFNNNDINPSILVYFDSLIMSSTYSYHPRGIHCGYFRQFQLETI